ncbi:MAG: hypothetical protein ACRENS_08745 [Candidatus Eiseniibacteriota bacterium]
MRLATPLWIGLAVLLSGCDDQTAPRDLTPPAAPRGVYSVTGDGAVTLQWLANTEADVAGYRVYQADCPDGPSCPYMPVGATGSTTLWVGQLPNGQTRYFAVTAIDQAGNESELSYENVMDTPRPSGSGLLLTEATAAPATAGYRFAAYRVLPSDDPSTDIFYQLANGVPFMVCPFTDTDIQDAGYATSLDAVDFAPLVGWAASGTAELTPGHCYVLRLGLTSVNYAKFRVVSLSGGQVVLDWAYQVDPNNRELRAQPVQGSPARTRRASVAPAAGLETSKSMSPMGSMGIDVPLGIRAALRRTMVSGNPAWEGASS